MLQLVVLLAVPFIWCGMVAAISLLETPLKFKAPGITVELAVGIGRLVFKALNTVEAALAVALTAAAVAGPRQVPAAAAAAIAAAVLALAFQMVVLRPRMAKGTLQRDGRADVAGVPTASAAPHLGYIAAELVKIVALPAAGILMVLAVAS